MALAAETYGNFKRRLLTNWVAYCCLRALLAYAVGINRPKIYLLSAYY